MSGTATPLELSWTVGAVIGFLFSAWLAFGGWLDLRSVQAGINDVPPRAVAWGPRWWNSLDKLVGNTLFFYPWLVFFVVGLIAMSYPPPPPNPDQHVSSQWVGWLLLSGEVMIAVIQVWHTYARNRTERSARVSGWRQQARPR